MVYILRGGGVLVFILELVGFDFGKVLELFIVSFYLLLILGEFKVGERRVICGGGIEFDI